ncbi:MAG: AI-2E family transporter [Cyanobacteria bacterium]|nr:AI-2E family transporter [Cyanobacteriota bacterium]
MAEPRENGDKEKAAVIPHVPTQITAPQVIAVILALAACRYARDIIAPLLLAVLAAVALAPLVRGLSRIVPRWLAAAVVVLSIAGAFGVTAWVLSDDLATFSRRLPAIVRDIRDAIQSASPRQSLIRQLQQAVTELEQTTKAAKPPAATPVTIVETVDVQRQMMTYARSAGTYLSSGILLLFLIYFLLSEGELFKQKLVKLSGERLSQKKVTVQMIDEITAHIGRFVFYQFWSGLLVGTITWLVFAWLGVRYAGLWGVAAGVLNCIPYFGPTIVMVGSSIAAVMQFQTVSMVALVAGTSLAITSLEGFLLAPIALGRAASVNSVAIFVAVMFWGWMWGPLGLVLAVPMLMIVKTIADHVETMKSISELLGDRR